MSKWWEHEGELLSAVTSYTSVYNQCSASSNNWCCLLVAGHPGPHIGPGSLENNTSLDLDTVIAAATDPKNHLSWARPDNPKWAAEFGCVTCHSADVSTVWEKGVYHPGFRHPTVDDSAFVEVRGDYVYITRQRTAIGTAHLLVPTWLPQPVPIPKFQSVKEAQAWMATVNL